MPGSATRSETRRCNPVPLQAWYAMHPPKRGDWWMGTRPFVHQGFLKSWVANGLNKRIVERCTMAVKKMQDKACGVPIKVYITGMLISRTVCC